MPGEHDDQVSMGNVVAGYNKAIEVDSPYYLHPSDNPGLVFVTHPMTENGENYFTSRRKMMTALESKNNVGFVDNSVTKPDVNSQYFQPWVKCNAIVFKPRDKFTSCSRPRVFVGYPNGKKEYQIFDLEDKHIYMSQDVQFFKENYLFAMHNPFAAPHESQQPNSSDFGPHATMDSPLDVVCERNKPVDIIWIVVPSSESNCAILEPHSNGQQAEPKEVSKGSDPVCDQDKIYSGASDDDNSTPESNSSLDEILIPAKRMRKVSGKLSDFNFVLPLSIALPRSPNPSANSTVHPLSHCLSLYQIFSQSYRHVPLSDVRNNAREQDTEGINGK
ncbi:hypothetical protein RJ640_009095 [Escallonia rubra]|uniref:Uncharacterized protein n=1 Tax=Escallonia rubra TaxID=112253 RepID=A0AA88RY38_9ASTE|nr:hypothetical protein RJ640_009095 [Escallonia rubra]